MRTISQEKKLCMSCMEEHEVVVVELEETGLFKGETVVFPAVYEYCTNSGEYSETEVMMTQNSLSQKDAYRKKAGLLTSMDIKSIREKYDISQKEFSVVLDWGMATITRYENHQVQDRAHDDILRKISSDPEWFIEMLVRAKSKISAKQYVQYHQNALELLDKLKNPYKHNSLSISYSLGGMSLSNRALLDKSNASQGYTVKYGYEDRYSIPAVSVQISFAGAA